MLTTRRSRAMTVVVAMLVLVAPLPAARAAEGEGGVLVVGDSLQELTAPYLAQHLPPGVELTVNVGGGYNSFQIYDLFEESYDPSQSVVVFDAGTNDNPAYPEILAGNLAKVAATVGDRCMVVPTVHGYTVDGIDNTGKNRVVREFAAARPGTQVPDWAAAEAAHPELMQSDDLHPIQAGAELRAELIARGIIGCLSGAGTQLGGATANAGAPSGGAASVAAASRTPVLSEAPQPLAKVSRMARRQTALLRAMGEAVAGQAALQFARAVFPR